MTELPNEFISQSLSGEGEKALITIAKIEHPQLNPAVLVADNTEDVVHLGETYQKCSFSAEFPDDNGERPNLKVSITSADEGITRALLNTQRKATATFKLLHAHDLDVAIEEYKGFELISFSDDGGTIIGEFATADYSSEPATLSATKEACPILGR